MRQVRWWLGALAGVMAVAGAARATASADEPARVIVKLRAPVVQLAEPAGPTWASAQSAASSERGARQRMWALGQRAGVSLSESRELGGRTHLARAQGMSSAALARRLAAQSDVEYAVVDERRKPSAAPLASVPNDPLYATDQWYLQDPQATGGQASSINAPAAWAITHGNPSVVVAVLDTGVRYDHPDLQGKLLPGYNMISSPVVANNGVGRSDNASDLGDWLTQAEKDAHPEVFTSKCPVQSSSSWHGTRVAGLLGASTHNAIGMASLSWNVRVLPVRVLGKCGGYDSDIRDGMLWAAGVPVGGLPNNPYPAKVINLSLGAQGACSQAYRDVITELARRGVVVVAASGNTQGQAVEAPGNCPGVIAVSAVRHIGTKVGYSSIGPEVSVSAPGGNCVNTSGACLYPIVTTTNTGVTLPAANSNAYTGPSDPALGTSFAAPLVSATAAMMLSVHPGLTPALIKQRLEASATPFPSSGAASGVGSCQAPGSTAQDECYCTGTTCGAGMLNAGAAVAAAAQDATAAVAVITLSPEGATVGQPVVLSATDSRASAGATGIVTRQWELVSGGGIVSALGGDVGADSVNATPTAAGSFTVRLTVTDDQGQSATTDLTVPVGLNISITQALASTTPAPVTQSGGGGGGGAMTLVDLAVLGGAAVLAALSGRVGQTRQNGRRRQGRPK